MKFIALIPFLLPVAITAMAKTGNLCPDNHHPHMIDLGLPSGTKWACCNVGSTSPHDFGNYYAWGETVSKATFSWENYPFGNGVNDCRHLGYDIAGTDYDVALRSWHTVWRMPDIVQIKELKEKCKSVWTTQNGVKGALVTGPNGNQIFLPAAGSRCLDNHLFDGIQCLYWSSTQGFQCNAYYLGINTKSMSVGDECRFYGMPVRPVALSEQNVSIRLKDQDGRINSVKIDMDQEIATLISGFPATSIAYKRCFLDISEDEQLSDVERMISSILIFSTDAPSQRTRENLVDDFLKGKYGDCCVLHADGIIFHKEKGKKYHWNQ